MKPDLIIMSLASAILDDPDVPDCTPRMLALERMFHMHSLHADINKTLVN